MRIKHRGNEKISNLKGMNTKRIIILQYKAYNMILRTILSILVVITSTSLAAQSFLNGSFEVNSATEQCTYNISNSTYNQLMANSTAFGEYESLDIVQNGCYLDGIPDGSFSVSIANTPNDNQVGEAISLELAENLIIGESYTFTFQSIAMTDFGPQGNLLIGASTEASEFGVTLFDAATVEGVWNEYTVSFVAEEAVSYITVMPVPGISSWNSVDAFEFIENCQVEGIDEQIACAPFTWIDGVNYTQSTTFPQFVISGGAMNGCDSLVTLDLTIIELEAEVEMTTDGFICLNQDVNYQWYDCTNGNLLLENEIDSSFSPLQTGSYFVEIMNNACTSQSDCLPFEVTHIDEQVSHSITMFPNPSTDHFELRFTTASSAQLIIYDALGAQVASNSFSSQTHFSQQLDVKPGVYMVVVKSEGGIWVERLIVE